MVGFLLCGSVWWGDVKLPVFPLNGEVLTRAAPCDIVVS